jgi:hypothetical protein
MRHNRALDLPSAIVPASSLASIISADIGVLRREYDGAGFMINGGVDHFALLVDRKMIDRSFIPQATLGTG